MKGGRLVDKRELDLFLTESELMQVCASTHVMTPFREDLNKYNFIQSNALKWKSHGTKLKTAGRVIIIHTPPTKSGKRVMFLTLEDEEGVFDLTVFEDVRARHAKKILASTVLLVEGVVHRFGLRGVSIVARHFFGLSENFIEGLNMERIKVSAASWTDKILIKRGTFYPRQVTTAAGRLRCYAARFYIPRPWAQHPLPGITTWQTRALRVLSRRPEGPSRYAAQSALALFEGAPEESESRCARPREPLVP
jgi:error-prone DNA polymerase